MATTTDDRVKVTTRMPQWAYDILSTSVRGMGPLDSQMAKGRSVSALVCHLLTEGPLAKHAPKTKGGQ